jgi:cytochrome c553
MISRGQYAVHHLGYSSDEADNLISLCVQCHRAAHAENDIEKDPNNNHKPVKISDETYWQLREMRDEMAKDRKSAVSFDEVIQYLFTRERISLRQGE